ncbi:MAG: serine/threonine protein kinase [Planctomycetaceae bacterium]|nr:MAG: serine/threonine protein kinase [Planctomycetaceae bacterium]
MTSLSLFHQESVGFQQVIPAILRRCRMAGPKVDELCRQLVGQHLVEQAQLDICLGDLGAHASDAESVISWLESKGLLTSLQAGKIRRGETADLILGPFRLMYRNASGSFARVYRARDIRTGKMVGLKVLRQRYCDDPAAVDEFRREAELGKSLRHENIVPIFDVAVTQGQHYLSMEFVEGGNLRDFISIRKKLEPLEATKCVLEMAEGLSYALGKGATHRDLKMTNVLMSSTGVAKLVDFGLASISEDGGETESAARALEYATLEKNTGAPRDDPRSDLYFLGAIYYELLTGTAPLPRTRDRNERSQFSRYLQVRPVRQLEPGLPRSVASIVDRMLQLNPHLRYQTPAEAVKDLKSALAELAKSTGTGLGTGPGDSVPSSPAGADGGAVQTVMCLDDRPKQQDMLREYFSKHGFRVLVLSDLSRGLHRLQTQPPDCMIIMGDAFGADAVQSYIEAAAVADARRVGVVLVLGAEQSHEKSRLPQTDHARVVTLPATLRDLRQAVKVTLNGSAVD